jgi:uncharacterized protein
MVDAFLFDFLIVSASAAAAVIAGRTMRISGAAALGVAAAAAAVVVVQLNQGGLAEIGLSGWPDLVRLAPLILGGLAACYAIAAITSYSLAQLDLAPDITRLDFVRGNFQALSLMLLVSWTTAAFGEEIVFRGFLLNRAAGLPIGNPDWVLMVIAGQALLFGLAHAYQGLGGVIVTGVLGLALGVLTYAANGDLWPAIIVHGLINTVSLTAIYLSGPRLERA